MSKSRRRDRSDHELAPRLPESIRGSFQLLHILDSAYLVIEYA